MLVKYQDRKCLQSATSHKSFCEASGRAECGKSACSVRCGGEWKPAYDSISEALSEETESKDRSNLRSMAPFLDPTNPPGGLLCRLAKSLSHSEQMEMVGRGGGDRTKNAIETV